MEQSLMSNARAGQSLLEVLLAVAIGGILIGSAAVLISVILTGGAENKAFQGATFLAQDLADKIRVYATRNWHCVGFPCGVYNLSKGSANKYFLETVQDLNEGVFTYGSGATSSLALFLNGIQYSEYFYVQNVCRSGSITGEITGVTNGVCGPGEVEDPSTQKVTVVVTWSNGSRKVEIEEFFTRNLNIVFKQDDWSGGADPAEVVPPSGFTNKFYSADNINTATTGRITILGF